MLDVAALGLRCNSCALTLAASDKAAMQSGRVRIVLQQGISGRIPSHRATEWRKRAAPLIDEEGGQLVPERVGIDSPLRRRLSERALEKSRRRKRRGWHGRVS